MKNRAYLLLAGALLLAPAAEAKTLVYCAAAGPEGFDPAVHAAAATFDATRPLYNRLVQYEPGGSRIVPALAASWSEAPDGLTYTFRLRPGVRFQTTAAFAPTRPLTADDVVFSFERQRKKNPYFDYRGGIWPFYAGLGMDGLVKSVTAVDDATVRFTLTRPDAGFLADLTMDFASVLSKEYADRLLSENRREALDAEPVGTGPFQFSGRDADGTVRYKANPAYWGGPRWIDDLVIAAEPDAATRLQKLKAGACQAIAAPAAADLAAIAADPALALLTAEGNDVGYLAVNTLQKPFDDVRVRQAIGLAIDRKAIVDAVFGGGGSVAGGLVPPRLRPAGSVAPSAAYDPDRARQLLAAASVKDLAFKIAVPRMARSYNPDAIKTADLIKADLAKVGVTVEVVPYDWGAFIRHSAGKERDGAVLFGWEGFNGDPETFLSPLFACDTVGGANRANWCSKTFDALIQGIDTATIPGEGASLFQQAEALIAADQPATPLARSAVAFATAKSVKDLAIDVTGRPVFDRVEVTE